MFRTFFADNGTLEASISAGTDIFSTVYTCFTAMAEVSFTARTIYTGITPAADILFCTVGTFFVTVRTDGGTLRTAFSAVAYGIYAVTTVAAV